MCGGRVIYVQGRSDHGRISRDFWQNRPENVSRASAFAEGTHPDRGFASVFVTAPDGLKAAYPQMRLPACLQTERAHGDPLPGWGDRTRTQESVRQPCN